MNMAGEAGNLLLLTGAGIILRDLLNKPLQYRSCWEAANLVKIDVGVGVPRGVSLKKSYSPSLLRIYFS